ncbi:type VII secretion protein EccCa [Nocardioides sp. MH1]|uniref:type VII secretion protein EccCa n=1 Tax=Nocardioides sp. MH1 TaxID=3242490 RepID=UPI0035210B99
MTSTREAPSGTIAIDPPPRLPTGEGATAVAMSAIPMLGSLGSVALVASLGGGSATIRLLAAGLFLATTVTYLGLQIDRQRVQRRRQVHRARQAYLRHLAGIRTRARDAAAAHRAAQLSLHPPPVALPGLVDGGGTRARDHPAFLKVRYGVGAGPSAVTLQAPDDLDADDADPAAVEAARRLVARHREQQDLPVVVDLPTTRLVTITGAAAREVARSVVCAAAVAHSAADLAIAVCCTDEGRSAWEWAKWLPHTHSPERADDVGGVRLVDGSWFTISALLPAEGHVLLIVDGPEVPDDLPRRVTVLAVGTSPPPAADGITIDTSARAGVRPDRCDPATAEAVARRLLALAPSAADPGSAPEEGAPPDLTAMLGLGSVARWDPAHTWAPRGSTDQLRVPIGAGPDGPVHLDLKESALGGAGPHGLVVGATGSGKSELLRTLVLGLTVTHAPDELNLVLADFKGGATFAGMAPLPHVSAMITNLAEELTLVDRMEDALAGEMVRRQEVLRAAGNLASVREHRRAREQGARLDPLPSLLVVVDEFSELLLARPDLTELFVTIGRLGRSLGMHLLLASQRLEEGRLRGLDAHLSYRIALRTFSAQESRTVLGVPDAFTLPAVPGMGLLKAGPSALVRFRSAYVSGPQDRPASRARPTVLPFATREVHESRGRVLHIHGAGAAGADSVLDAAVERMQDRPPRAHRIWLPPLDVAEPLERLVPLGGPLRLPVGVVDRPREQRRDPLVLDLSGASGHVAVVGGPRSGRSTLLRTLVTASALTSTPLETQWFVLDLGGALALLRDLPHIAGYAGRGEVAVIRRTIAELTDLADRRESGGGEDRYGTVHLCIDGWEVLRHDHDDLALAVQQLARRGLGLGIHLALATSRWSDLRPALRDQLGTRLELRLGDPADSEIDRKAATAVPIDRPGRGLVAGPLHFLAARPPDPSVVRWDGPEPPRLRLLPARVALTDVRRQVGPECRGLVLGIDEAALAPVVLDPDAGRHLLVLGDSRAGKSALLRTYVHEVVRTRSPAAAQLVVVDFRRSLLGEVPEPHLLHHLASADQARPAIEDLARYLRGRMPGPGVSAEALRRRSWWQGAEVFVVVDDYDLVATQSGSPLLPLQPLLAQAQDVGLHLVVARRTGGAGRALFEPVLQSLRELGGPGVLLSGSREEGPLLGGVRPEPAAPGRARLVTRDRTQVLQVAWSAPAHEP